MSIHNGDLDRGSDKVGVVPSRKEMWQPRTPSKCYNCDNTTDFERLADPDSMKYLYSSMVALQGVTSKEEKHVDAYECKVCGYVHWMTRTKVDLS